jgi:DNA/RNA-binding domain of Phe-tRNA-synthetase-like protein
MLARPATLHYSCPLMEISIAPHPLLRLEEFATRFPAPQGSIASPSGLTDLLSLDARTPFQPDESLRTAIRDMLRHGGYKPTGRGKPASEYLSRAAAEGALESINVAVDACNAASLHGGFPISVIDLDRAQPPFHIALAGDDHSYVFNPSGQEIRLGGLLCLFDADGPCANAVRDAQRTKTDATTTRTLSIVWGCADHEGRLRDVTRWYRSLLESVGATTS